jgi:hypothetical protein
MLHTALLIVLLAFPMLAMAQPNLPVLGSASDRSSPAAVSLFGFVELDKLAQQRLNVGHIALHLGHVLLQPAIERLPKNSYSANQPVMCRGWLVLGCSSPSLEIEIL